MNKLKLHIHRGQQLNLGRPTNSSKQEKGKMTHSDHAARFEAAIDSTDVGSDSSVWFATS